MRSHRPHPPPSSSSYPSSGRINIAASAPKLPVDNRISLNKYYRIADQILRQADIFRLEKNIIDLYIMLLRFSGLVVDTIPNHRDFDPSDKRRKHLKMKLFNILNELEELKPEVQRINSSGYICQNVQSHSPTVKMKPMTSSNVAKAVRPFALNSAYQGPRTQQFSFSRPVEEQFRRISLQPKAETLSRHSILGPNGLYGQWQPPRISSVVQYPSNIDVTPVEIPSLQQLVENGDIAGKGSNNSKSATLQSSLDNRHDVKTDCSDSEPEKSKVESILTSNGDSHLHRSEEPSSLISFEATETPVQTDIIRQPSPPAVLAEVQDLIPAMSPQVSEAEQKLDISSPDDFVCSEPLQLHISTAMMESFMKLAKSNTDRNLETCGVLAGTLKNRKFYVTALIIPKQESTPDSCQTTNEEEIFEVQDKRSLFPLGWIHTHPTQSCFMSSIDVHTHYSYQIMLPEAVAIVMAPRDTAKKHGIFRLTTPGGMSVIRQCQLRGFHPHSQPPDGGPIYKSCTDVYMNPNLKFDVIDLR